MSEINIKEAREKLQNLIIDKAYFKEKITLSSGKTSDYYIDARIVTLDAEGVFLTASIILDMVKDLDLDAIGGPTLGADPLIGAINVLCFQTNKNISSFIIRKSAKPHGKQRQTEGPELKKGSKVVIIDDVATTGKAFLQSIDVLTEMGAEVLKAICIVDRQEGAKEALKDKGVELLSIFKIEDIHK